MRPRLTFCIACLCTVVIAALLKPSRLQADTSWYAKLSELRFSQEELVLAADGEVDLSLMAPQMLVKIEGDILFFPGEFLPVKYLSAAEFQNLRATKDPIRFRLSNKTYPTLSSDMGSAGGTFLLRLHGLKPDRIGFKPLNLHHPGEWYIAQSTGQQRLIRYGLVTNDYASNWLRTAQWSSVLEFDNQSDMILYIHASAPLLKGQSSLTISSMMLSYGEHWAKVDFLRRCLLMGITGGLCIVFLFHAFIFLFRRRDESSLYLSLYAFCAFILGLFYSTSMGFSITMLLDVFTLVNMLAIFFLQSYLIHKMIGIWSAGTRRKLLYCSLFLILFYLVCRLADISSLYYGTMLSSFVFSTCLIVSTAYWGFRHKIDGIYFFLCGAALNAIFQASLLWAMFKQPNSSNAYFVLLADFSMAVSLALVNAKEYSRAFHTAQRLTRDLQKEVESQTEKLRLQKDKLEAQKVELVRTHEELKENDEQKTRFFRSISHELRTPLTLILGALDESEEPQRMKRSIHMANKHAKRLYRLVNQLLDFQKIAMSKVKLRTERVDLLSFLSSFAKSVEDACQRSGIEFQFHAPSLDSGGYVVKAQLDALEKILFNYFGNALKFTPQHGTIKLELSCTGATVRVAVRDSGCGIPEGQQGKLFKLFSQIEGPQQQGKQGSGIGLALVKELALQMQGRVGVESAEGQGSCFWLDLPRLISDAEAHTFLYFDPVSSNRALMQELFSRHNLESKLYCPDSAEDAVQLLVNYPIQVLMLSAAVGDAIHGLLETCQSLRPECWRVLMFDKSRPQESKSLSTHGIQAIHSIPADESFMRELKLHYAPDLNAHTRAVLDLVYVEDEEHVRLQFIEAIARYSLIERYEIISSFEDYRKLSQHYRVKVLICDGNLSNTEKGTDILAYAARTSPDTVRILFTGQATADLLAAGIQEGQAQYIIYKPMDYAKEFAIIEKYIAESPLEPRELTLADADFAARDWHLADVGAAQAEEATVDNTESARVSGRATILIVDDVRDMRIILQDILHEAGYRVLQAENGADALHLLKVSTQRIDLVIADWMMPVRTGVELLHDLHNDPRLASIPTILLTAKSDDESRSQGLKVGASAYLSKPFDRLEILSVIGNLLELKEREKQLADLNNFISYNVLQRFLPPELVKDLVAGKAVFDDAAKLQTITVLFADLCEFTSSTERLGPTKLARILNSFLVSMTDVIFEEGGTIDKFIGDAILVIFGAPARLDPMEQARRAHRCALRMQDRLKELNQQWQSAEQHTFQMRMGIHMGPAIVGSFGGQKRSDYTAIGQTVNIAARIEAQAQPGEILVSMEVRDYLDEDIWQLAGSYQLKGVAMPLNLYRIIRVEKKSAA